MKFIFIVFLLCLILFAKYIFGGYVYLFTDIGSDTINLYYPTYYFNSRLFYDTFSWYSFNMGVGLSTVSMNYYLFDPFSYIIYLFPKQSISSAIVYTIILKILFAAWFSYKYFKELMPDIEEVVAWIGAIALAFSGYFILWGQHFFFSSAMVYFPLLLFGFELLLKYNRKFVFLIATALLAMFLFFFYQVMVFFSLYVIIRVFVADRFLSFRSRVLFVAKQVIPIMIIGVLLVAFRIFPAFYELSNNPRINAGSFGLFNYLSLSSLEFIGNSFLRLFSNNFWGCSVHYFGFLNYYESPQLYCSLLILILAPQAFFIKDKRHFFLIGSLALFLVLLGISPYLSYVFNGFQYPSYRWGMIASFSMIILGITGLISYTQSPTKFKRIILIVTPLIYLALILFVTSRLKQSNFWPQIIKVILFFVLYVGILIFLGKKKRWLFPALFVIFIFDVAFEHYPTINQRRAIKSNFEESGQYYFDGCIEAVNSLKEQDQSFYRMIKSNYSLFLDDPFIQAYNGVTCYNAINDPYYLRFLKKNHVPLFLSENTSYIVQFGDRPVLYNLLSVKYYISNQFSGTENLIYADSLRGKYCYLRPNALPLGFTFDSYITEDKAINYSDDFLLKSIILNKNPGIDIKALSDHDVMKEKLYEPAMLKPDQSEFSFINVKPLKDNEYESTSNDPMFILSDFNYLYNSKCRIEYDLLADKTGCSQLYWKTDTEDFAEQKSLLMNFSPGLTHIVFEPELRNGFTTDVNEIRIDPVNYPGRFKLDNITLTFYNEKVSMGKVNLQVDSVKYRNVKRTQGNLIAGLKLDAANIDPQIVFSIPPTNTDTSAILISFNLKTENDSYCQLYWNTNHAGFTEMNSKTVGYSGGKTNRVKFKLNNGIINQLRLDPGDKSSVYELSDFNIGRLSIDKNEEQQLYSSLRSDTLSITSFKPDHIKGTINVDVPKLLFLSIPYNKGWTITCNGQKTEPLIADYGFMALPLKKGNYSIELKFFPYPMKAGITISVATLFLLLIYSGFRLRKREVNLNVD